MANAADATTAPGYIHDALRKVEAAKGALRIRHAARFTALVHENDPADYSLLLVDGWVALSKTLPSGDAQITDVMLPGDFALVGTRILPVAACTMEALSDTRYILISPSDANGPGPAAADLRQALAASVLTTQSRTSELILRLGRGDAANRVAYALLEIYVRLQAVGLTRGASFDFPIRQQKFGEYTGLTNVHVCRTMRRFVRAGLIRSPDPGTIELLNLPALCDLADLDLDRFKAEIVIKWPGTA